jgi:hypothetical protein
MGRVAIVDDEKFGREFFVLKDRRDTLEQQLGPISRTNDERTRRKIWRGEGAVLLLWRRLIHELRSVSGTVEQIL